MASSSKSAGKPDPAIIIGRVVRPHGIRGELRIEPLTDFPERFQGLDRVYLDRPAGGRWWDVTGARPVQLGWLLKLDGLDNPEDGAAWRGAQLMLPRAEAVPLPEDVYYIDDLRGLSAEASDGTVIGTVREVFSAGQDILEIVRPDGKDFLVPLVKAWVPEVDLARRRLVVANWEALLPEAAEAAENPGDG